MPKLKLDVSMSLDGYIAAPDPSLEDPLGVGGMRLHEWVFGLKSFREQHGMEGGESRSPDDEIVAEITQRHRRRRDGTQDVQRRRGAVGERSQRPGLVG